MNGVKDMFASERGVFVVILVLLVTLLVFLGKITSSEWIDYTKWLAVMFIGGKTISHAVETMKAPALLSIPRATAEPAPPPPAG